MRFWVRSAPHPTRPHCYGQDPSSKPTQELQGHTELSVILSGGYFWEFLICHFLSFA